ncbi:unnamed protein product, partial [Ectocarpus sp. 4 AP-2014]
MLQAALRDSQTNVLPKPLCKLFARPNHHTPDKADAHQHVFHTFRNAKKYWARPTTSHDITDDLVWHGLHNTPASRKKHNATTLDTAFHPPIRAAWQSAGDSTPQTFIVWHHAFCRLDLKPPAPEPSNVKQGSQAQTIESGCAIDTGQHHPYTLSNPAIKRAYLFRAPSRRRVRPRRAHRPYL